MKSAQVTVTLIDGDVLTVRTVLRDQIRYEDTAKRQKPPWGGVADNPGKWEGFVSWAALKRTGQVDSTYEAYCDTVADIEFDFDAEVLPTSRANGGA